ILGLFVPGAGEVAVVLGAAVAAEHILSRWSNHTLRFDAALVTDLIALLGAAAMGASVVGNLRVVSARGRFLIAAAEADEAALLRATAELQRAAKLADITEIANHVVSYGGLMW